MTEEAMKQMLARNNKGKEVIKVKVVELCGSGHCPVLKVADKHVEIGEKDNVCVLTKSEWEVLKQKILNREI